MGVRQELVLLEKVCVRAGWGTVTIKHTLLKSPPPKSVTRGKVTLWKGQRG